MKIVVLCEGATEAALRQGLREFVQSHASGVKRTGIETRSLDGPTLRKKLERLVRNSIDRTDIIAVVALSDVYPGYQNASETKEALRRSAGSAGKDSKFRAHAALFEVEAWILPFWDKVAQHLGVKATPPSPKSELVDGQKPPSHHLKELYRRARREFDKVMDGPRWLTADGLMTASNSCPELKSLLNSLLEFAGAAVLP